MVNGLRKLPLGILLVRLFVLAGMVYGSLDCVIQAKWYELAAGVGGIIALLLAWWFLDWLCPGKFCSILDIAVSLLTGQGIVWGTIYHGYDHFSVYDTLIHFLFGMVLAWAGILLLYRKTKGLEKDQPFDPGLVLLFGLSFTMLGKFVWELYEFAGDRWVAADMQRWQEGDLIALTDTMIDLAVGLLGALIIGLLVYWKLRRDPEFYQRRIAPLMDYPRK